MRKLLWSASLLLVTALPAALEAQQSFGRGFGARVGADLEDGNFLLGGHVNLWIERAQLRHPGFAHIERTAPFER